ncbi:MAG: tryptophan-rich sensory protein [Clostridia bacterium]|nr:tryptophan-rich sensory protein [Clostridia bacterium]
MNNSTTKIVYSFLFIILVAVLGSVFVALGMNWFGTLDRPSEWVPNVLIPIVWSVIYLTFAIVFYLWNKNGEVPQNVVWLALANGVLNVVWCLVYFTLNQLLFGLIFIILNLIFAILLWNQIYNSNKTYAYFLSIYPIWLCVATCLNLATWILN